MCSLLPSCNRLYKTTHQHVANKLPTNAEDDRCCPRCCYKLISRAAFDWLTRHLKPGLLSSNMPFSCIHHQCHVTLFGLICCFLWRNTSDRCLNMSPCMPPCILSSQALSFQCNFLVLPFPGNVTHITGVLKFYCNENSNHPQQIVCGF